MKKILSCFLLTAAGVILFIAANAQTRPKKTITWSLLGDRTDNAVGIAGKGTDVASLIDGVARVPWGEGGKIGLFAIGLPEATGRTVLPVTIVLKREEERWIIAAEVGSIRIEELQQVTFEVPENMQGEFEVRVGVRGWLSDPKRLVIERF